MVTARLKKSLRHLAMAKDAWVLRGILVRLAAGQVAVSPIAGSTGASFVPRAKACRSGTRGVGWEAW
jgi:hypothetical protein